LSTLESGMMYVALPTIAAKFQNLGDVSWLITAFVLMQAGTAAVAGRLGDLMGRRRVLVWVLALCATGSAISAFSMQLGWIVIGRAIQGISGAVLPLCFGIARQSTPPRQLPVWVGVLISANIVSGALAFLIGGIIAQFGSWHWIFYVTLGLPIITLVIVF